MPCFDAMRALQSGTDSRQHVCVRNAILMQSTVSVVRLQKASPFLVSVHASCKQSSTRRVLTSDRQADGCPSRKWNWACGEGLRISKIWQAFGRPRDRINTARAARNRSLLAVCSQLEPKPLHFIPCKAAFIIYSYTATQPVLVTCGRTDDLRARFQPFQNLVDKGLVVHPLQYARVYSARRDERPWERIWGAVSYIGVRENHAVSDWPSLQRGD